MPSICDFCGIDGRGPTPARSYPCRDFDMGTPSTETRVPANNYSDGAWLACRRCSALIDATDREGLTERCVTRTLEVNPMFQRLSAAECRPILTAALGELHGDFWRHREGPGRDLTPEERRAEPEPDTLEWKPQRPRRAAWLSQFGA